MDSLEGHQYDIGRYNAAFYKDDTYSTAWTKVSFVDHLGEQFESMHIRLKSITNDCHFSFDPRAVDDATRVVQGIVKASETIMLKDKHASEIYLKRAGGSDSNVQIMAWR